MTKQPTYHLLLRPLPRSYDPDGVLRIRAALKCLLRCFALRCTSIERTHADAPPGPNQGPPEAIPDPPGYLGPSRPNDANRFPPTGPGC